MMAAAMTPNSHQKRLRPLKSVCVLALGGAGTCGADGADALIGAARKCVGSERARAFGLGVNWGSEMQ